MNDCTLPSLLAALAALSMACVSEPLATRDPSASPDARDLEDSGPEDAAAPPDAAADLPDASSPDALPDVSPDASPPPAPRECVWSASGADTWRELDVMGASSQRLSFDIPGLPDPSALEGPVTLAFDTFDADHPGQEGEIRVNGQGGRQIPAQANLDNAQSQARVDVTGDLVAGTNQITFGAGATPRTFYRIRRVRLEARARVDACDQVTTDPDPGPRVERLVHYRDATYTQRNNWVLRCDDYAFTAFNKAEHAPSDCDGLFDPDGGRRGMAHFDFPAVAPGRYEVEVRARHTANRNPNGALFLVDGEGKRLDQVDPDGPRANTTWGFKGLSGDVRVTLDSTQESQSDSVIWVKLIPR